MSIILDPNGKDEELDGTTVRFQLDDKRYIDVRIEHGRVYARGGPGGALIIYPRVANEVVLEVIRGLYV